MVFRRVFLPLLVMLALWAGCVFGVAAIADATIGPYAHEQLEPFKNAHLAEEAFDGLYHPLRDPNFLAYAILKSAIVFGVGGFFAAVGATGRSRAVALVPGLIGLALALQFASAVSSGSPLPFRLASLFQIACFACAFVVGLLFARPKHRGPSVVV